MKVPVIVYGPGMGDLGTRFPDYKACLHITSPKRSAKERQQDRDALKKGQLVDHGKYFLKRSV